MTNCCASEPLDPRVRRTQKLLQDALRGLMEEKRFSEISVSEIAARATINRATFYAHYPDKETLAARVLQAALHTALTRPDATAPPALTPETLTEFAVKVFTFMGSLHDSCPETAAELQNTVGPTVQQGLYEMIEGWLTVQAGSMRLFPGSAKETVATVLSWSLYGGALCWSREKNRPPAQEICREMVGILLPLPTDHAPK